jgi:uncharacterized protein (DUF305 family)
MASEEASEMAAMTKGLQGKAGAAFDKAFLGEMIAHHQGAIEMARMALKDAEHPEIKKLARAIVAAQTSEITEMQGWQQDWGLSVSDMPGLR